MGATKRVVELIDQEIGRLEKINSGIELKKKVHSDKHGEAIALWNRYCEMEADNREEIRELRKAKIRMEDG